MTDSELREVERLVSEKIRADYPLEEHRAMPVADAKAMGAMALFGEKYGDEVRVVKYGTSVELCGGTHIPSTGRIGSLRILAESSIAAGVRRIEAITAEKAEDYYYLLQDTLREIRSITNNMPDLVQTIRKAVNENAELKRRLEDFGKEKALTLKNKLLAEAPIRSGIRIIRYAGPGSADIFKDIAYRIKGELSTPFIFVAGINDNSKPTLMLMLSDDIVASGASAALILKNAAKHIQGGGGGQPHFATAGGKNPDGLHIAIEAILQELKIEE